MLYNMYVICYMSYYILCIIYYMCYIIYYILYYILYIITYHVSYIIYHISYIIYVYNIMYIYSVYGILSQNIIFHDIILTSHFILYMIRDYCTYNIMLSVSPLNIRNEYVAFQRSTKTQNKESNHLANKRYMVFSAVS